MGLLSQQLKLVASRFRRRDWWRNVSFVCLAGAAIGGLLLWLQLTQIWFHQRSPWVLGAAAGAALLAVSMFALLRFRNPRSVARRIESHFPELEQRLVTTLDQTQAMDPRRFGFLQHTVLRETLQHASRHPWSRVVSRGSLIGMRLAGVCSLLVLLATIFALDHYQQSLDFAAMARDVNTISPVGGEVVVQPGDAEIEKGSNLIVLARFGKELPKQVELVVDDGSTEERLTMTPRLDDPLFGIAVPAVTREFQYFVQYDGRESERYQITLFTFPELVRADAALAYPSYTRMPEKTVEDTRRVSAVEGTQLTWRLHLNKPVTLATLTSEAGDVLTLEPDSVDPLTQTVSMTLQESTTWVLKLRDEDGRENRLPPKLTAKVLPNRPPDLKLELARDARVSPLEEFLVKATVSDDYGLNRYGLTYTLASASPEEIVIGQSAERREKHAAEHLLDFEALSAEPDELLSYYFWAEDRDAGGQPRRTLSDMFFAEVRHFEEIFRQGQQPPGGQQPQGQQGQQGSQNARDAEQLAELQKQIINATWKLIRRETAEQVTPVFEEDVSIILESQQTAMDQSSELGQRLQDGESQQHFLDVQRQMQTSLSELTTAYSEDTAQPLTAALAAQQAAYQALLKLRAREHDVVQSQSSSSQSSSSSASRSRFQQQLQQLQLQNDQNRYESQRQAQTEQEQQESEVRQALSRLRELARRQEDLNKQLQELQTALQQAETEAEREEIERQLKRLRDQQREMLRDADELRDRLADSADQEVLRDTREQLEQTREQLRDSAEALEQGEVTPALASGTRAQRELENMREELRRQSADQFSEQMKQMREIARQLEQDQQELGDRLSEQAETERDQPGLRRDDPNEEENVGDALRQQHERLNELLRQMEETVTAAEEGEPLLAEDLYDAFRDTEDDKVARNLEAAAQLSDRGFKQQAGQLEREAREGITNLRENIERAAERVLGDETEALRYARDLLNELERELNEELEQFDPRGESANQSDLAQANGSPPPGQATNPEQSSSSARGGPSENEEPQDSASQPEQSQASDQTGQQSEQTGPSRSESSRQSGERQQPSSAQQPGSRSSDSRQSPSQQSGQSRQPSETEGQGQQSGGGGGRARDSQNRDAAEPRPQDGRSRSRDNRSLQSLRPRDIARDAADGGGFSGGAVDSVGAAPLTGDEYSRWSDRLRDVEEIVDDPELRAEAARIRDRARGFRQGVKRHSKEPQWSLVRELVSKPLRELRLQVSAELLRRSADKNALVPIDRDPVPDQYTEQVRRYYENLGSGF